VGDESCRELSSLSAQRRILQKHVRLLVIGGKALLQLRVLRFRLLEDGDVVGMIGGG
jgi:hypothetical protein